MEWEKSIGKFIYKWMNEGEDISNTIMTTYCKNVFMSRWKFLFMYSLCVVKGLGIISFLIMRQRKVTSSYFLSASSAKNRASLSWFSRASILSSSDKLLFSSTLRILNEGSCHFAWNKNWKNSSILCELI